MKKSDNKNRNKIENSLITISATLEEIHVLKCIIEGVASTRFEMGYSLQTVQPGWQAIETSSLEADVSGHINFSEKKDFINISVDTCFLFTCIKGKDSRYDLTWASSLS